MDDENLKVLNEKLDKIILILDKIADLDHSALMILLNQQEEVQKKFQGTQ